MHFRFRRWFKEFQPQLPRTRPIIGPVNSVPHRRRPQRRSEKLVSRILDGHKCTWKQKQRQTDFTRGFYRVLCRETLRELKSGREKDDPCPRGRGAESPTRVEQRFAKCGWLTIKKSLASLRHEAANSGRNSRLINWLDRSSWIIDSPAFFVPFETARGRKNTSRILEEFQFAFIQV